MASAQVKGAVLLAGLDADGETVVREPVATRAHTEEMLAEAGADVTVEATGAGRVVRLVPGALRPRAWEVPGDPSQAAFWVVAGAVVPVGVGEGTELVPPPPPPPGCGYAAHSRHRRARHGCRNG